MWEGGTDWFDLVQHKGQVAGTCKSVDTSGSIKCGEFFERAVNRLDSQDGVCGVE
jgi:hypothetical protein